MRVRVVGRYESIEKGRYEWIRGEVARVRGGEV